VPGELTTPTQTLNLAKINAEIKIANELEINREGNGSEKDNNKIETKEISENRSIENNKIKMKEAAKVLKILI
jgi:hypothetical protein